LQLKSILKSRENKNFKSLSDFISKIDSSKVNKKVLESLIKAGALDYFGFSRKAMLKQIDYIIDTISKGCTGLKKWAWLISLFG